MKIILLNCHKITWDSGIMSNAVKNFDILVISLNILHNYFDDPNKIIFRSVSS